MGDERFLKFLTKVYANISISLKPGGAFYVWGNPSKPIGELEMAQRAIPDLYGCTYLSWVKNAMVFNMRLDYKPRYEICKYGWKKGAVHYFCEDNTLTNVV